MTPTAIHAMQLRLDGYETGLAAQTIVLDALIRIVHDLAPLWVEAELRQARIALQLAETGQRRSPDLPAERKALQLLEQALRRDGPSPAPAR